MLGYIAQHGHKRITDEQLDYVETLVDSSAMYTTSGAGGLIIDIGGECFEDEAELPEWLRDTLEDCIRRNVQYLHLYS